MTQVRGGADVVRGFFLAHAEGRLEDMLAFVHPSMLWQPVTPLPRTFYSGHEGTLALFLDMQAVLGPFRCDLEELRELPRGHVYVRGHVAMESGDQRPFETWVEVEEGRLVRQRSEPAV